MTTFRGQKVKVTRPLNAVNEIHPYLRNGRAHKLETCYTDGLPWPASQTSAINSKIRCQAYKVTSSVWCIFAHNLTKKSCRTPKLTERLSVLRVTFSPVLRSKGHISRSPDG